MTEHQTDTDIKLLRSRWPEAIRERLDHGINLAEAEQAPGSANMIQLYDTTMKLAGKYSKPERPVKDKQARNTQDKH